MKKLSKEKTIFMIYSMINLGAMYISKENIGIFTYDIAFGLFISYMIYILSYLIVSLVTVGK